MLYSVLINRERKGLKKGVLLLSSLFAVSAEILSKMLNDLFDSKNFIGFTIDNIWLFSLLGKIILLKVS